MSAILMLGAAYREDAVLRDGRRVRLRLVRPSDKEKLAAGLQRMSSASRFARFLAAKSTLTPAELSFLTDLDGVNQVALGALELQRGGAEGEGVAVARFVRCADDPAVAEAAVAVIDAWQGQGLGRLLLERLAVAARERGVFHFRVEFLAGNETVRALIHEACPGLPLQADGATIAVDVPLPDLQLPATATRHPHLAAPLFELLRLAARRARPGGSDS